VVVGRASDQVDAGGCDDSIKIEPNITCLRVTLRDIAQILVSRMQCRC
jgi:hypothetical protein